METSRTHFTECNEIRIVKNVSIFGVLLLNSIELEFHAR